MNGKQHCFVKRVSEIFAVVVLITSPMLTMATGLNADLQVSPPDGEYYLSGDVLTATLTLTDDDGTVLHADQFADNGLQTIQFWISGPRQDLENIDPYASLVVLNSNQGFHPETGFDPETGEIDLELPVNLPVSGSYVLLVKCQRHQGNTWYSRYPKIDLKVDQRRPSYTPADDYIYCTNCHDAISHHGTSDLDNCFVCHTESYDPALSNMIHQMDHHPHDCDRCHRSAGGINHYSRTACFSCHNAPNNHRNYTDNQCAGCHTGNNGVYHRHDQLTPQTPESFSLLAPEDQAAVDPETTVLEWEESGGRDAADQVHYMVWISTDADFVENTDSIRTEDPEFALTDPLLVLEPGETYYWKVRAQDLNTTGRWSTETYQFSVGDALTRIEVPLQANYFEMISFPVVPEDLDAEVVFGDLTSLAIVYRADGSIYIPPVINTIGDLDNLNAYQVYCRSPEVLVMEGTPADQEAVYHISGHSWSWIGYPFSYQMPVEEALADIAEQVEIVQTDDGRFWIPELNINILGNMRPGEGYGVFAQADIDFQYIQVPPAATRIIVTTPVLDTPVSVRATGLPFVVIVSSSSNTWPAEADYLVIMDGDRVVGSQWIEQDDKLVSAIAWEEAPEQGLPGYQAGDLITVSVYNREGEQLGSIVSDQRFAEQPYAQIGMDLSESLPQSFMVGDAYPNPFNPSVTLPFTLPEAGDVSIKVFNMLGREIYSMKHGFDAGSHRFVFDALSTGQELVSGLYFIQIEFNGQVNSRKIVLMK